MWPIIIVFSICIAVVGYITYLFFRDMWNDQFSKEAKQNEFLWKKQLRNLYRDLREIDKEK